MPGNVHFAHVYGDDGAADFRDVEGTHDQNGRGFFPTIVLSSDSELVRVAQVVYLDSCVVAAGPRGNGGPDGVASVPLEDVADASTVDCSRA